MRYFTFLTVAALAALTLNSAEVSASPCPYTPLVQSWYQRYLHREPDPGGLHTWVSALRCGASPDDVQASILASEEYYCNRGKHCETGYVSALFTDVLGRAPCEHDIHSWTHRLRQLGCRKRLALEFFAASAPELAGRTARPVAVVPAVGHRHKDPRPLAPVYSATPFAPAPPHGAWPAGRYVRR